MNDPVTAGEPKRLKLTRFITAPRAAVWRAWTTVEGIGAWWGPHQFTNTVEHLEVRPGGRLRIVMHAPDGRNFITSGEFREISEPEKLGFTNNAVGGDGRLLLEGFTTVSFDEVEGRTRLTLETEARALVPEAVIMLAGMAAGWSQSLDRLMNILSPNPLETIMTTLNPYIFFNGDCAEAFAYYTEHLGAEVLILMTHRGTPAEAQTPPEWLDKIIHGRIRIGDVTVMASDAPPGHYHKPQGYTLTLGPQTVAEAERMFKALSDGGVVTMPLAETFWASRFGMLVDRFGIPWMVSCEKPM